MASNLPGCPVDGAGGDVLYPWICTAGCPGCVVVVG